ncbi:hypothetical protein Ctha_1486 [Chloroherpeton thalassium ATCC 35110]|uniref:Lipoprotein n=1 Tax=Chloroherpeton thalassium (strain ATCC 35110 / GB-78) TaxID=517418 RepID=B3QS00_CHLT3|nr:hypothetical protein [Chloroherpeton thalassium]ACF13945.1 hypothetical protein Ctha_1486 [Chloroherpeton thalassium ATCC 35110]
MKVFRSLLSVAMLLFFGCSSEVSYEDFKSAVDDINSKQRDIFEKSNEVSKIIRQVNQRFPDQKITFDTALGLSSAQEEKLVELIKQEKDVTYKGMLQELLNSEKEIFDLKEEVADIQSRLPKPYVVQKGDQHRKVCVNYLKDVEGLDEKAAKELVDRVALIDEMIPGFYIWLYYNKDTNVFGTFVTQGEAKVNPNRVRYSIRKEKLQEAYEKGMKAAQDSSAEQN